MLAPLLASHTVYYIFFFLPDVRLTEDGYRISFPQTKKEKHKFVTDFLIPIGTLECEIFHCYISEIHRELDLDPGDQLWLRGVEANESKASYFKHSPLCYKVFRSIPKYIAFKLGYDAKTRNEFRLISFIPKENDHFPIDMDDLGLMSQDSGDVANPCSSKSLESLTPGNLTTDIASESIESGGEDDSNIEPNIWESDSEFVEPTTTPSDKKFSEAEFHRFLGMVDTNNRHELVRAAFGCAAVYGSHRVYAIKNLKVEGMDCYIFTTSLLNRIGT